MMLNVYYEDKNVCNEVLNLLAVQEWRHEEGIRSPMIMMMIEVYCVKYERIIEMEGREKKAKEMLSD